MFEKIIVVGCGGWRDDHTVSKVKSFFLSFDFFLWLFLVLSWLSLDNSFTFLVVYLSIIYCGRMSNMVGMFSLTFCKIGSINKIHQSCANCRVSLMIEGSWKYICPFHPSPVTEKRRSLHEKGLRKRYQFQKLSGHRVLTIGTCCIEEKKYTFHKYFEGKYLIHIKIFKTFLSVYSFPYIIYFILFRVWYCSIWRCCSQWHSKLQYRKR